MLAGDESAPIDGGGDRLSERQPDHGPASARCSSSRLFRLTGGFCSGCNQSKALDQRICPRCILGDLGAVHLSAKGRLQSFTIVRGALPGYRGPMPYAVGTVTLFEGIELQAVVSGCHPEDLRPGMEVELGLLKICEDSLGREVVAQAFRPI
ncbi:MAG: OB-fold domain-containing protein [Chloroflexi bacterium]|nr:OB-fold domain-containing protein [Chloroflexota bacterium]